MCTAADNFTHEIRTRRQADHRLITGGVYRYRTVCACRKSTTLISSIRILRHPSYTGFILFALGTQMLLGNAITWCAFYFALRFYFRDRVAYEEAHLLAFFGRAYADYRSRTWAGIL